MGKKARRKALEARNDRHYIDCACLIHDTLYDWVYVDHLFNALVRNLTPAVKMHVYTEANRHVPFPYVHHHLEEWPGIRGPKQSWWYKIQLFNSQHHPGDLLYFDLDTVITGNIDWIWRNDPDTFHAARDFKHLFRPRRTTINSSVMWFNVPKYNYVYQQFDPSNVATHKSRYHGDQDYIDDKIPELDRQYLDFTKIKSYKWEVAEGGFDFSRRKPKLPGTPTILDDISVLVFHGNPKPAKVNDPEVMQHWR